MSDARRPVIVAASALALAACAALMASCAAVIGPSAPARDEAPDDVAVIEPTGETQTGAAADNARCEGCHVEVAAEWRRSLHRLSWDDPVFLAAYSIEPLAFCRGCHAPEADPKASPDPGARAIGVGCITCHADLANDGATDEHAAHGRPHAVAADLSTTAACDGCHEFDFPGRTGSLMQGTLTEHRMSRHADTACQTCHMKPAPRENGAIGKSHDFGIRSDPELLHSALEATAARRDARSITVTLRVAGAGHAVPTGDLFRRLEVRAFADGDGVASLRAPAIALQRVFRAHGTGTGTSSRVEARDDRVPASGRPRDVVLVFPDAIDGRRVRWEVVYQRMGPTLAASFGVDLRTDEIILATGTLDSPPDRQVLSPRTRSHSR